MFYLTITIILVDMFYSKYMYKVLKYANSFKGWGVVLQEFIEMTSNGLERIHQILSVSLCNDVCKSCF
jgi:hypothetical protein